MEAYTSDAEPELPGPQTPARHRRRRSRMPLSDRDKRTLRIGGIIAGVLLVGVLAMSLLSGGGEEVPDPRTANRPDATVSPTGAHDRDPEPCRRRRCSRGATRSRRRPGSTSPRAVGPRRHHERHGDEHLERRRTTTTRAGRPPRPRGARTRRPSRATASSTNVAGHQVVLLDVFTVSGVGAVQVEVDGQVYNVTVGEEFGPGQQLRAPLDVGQLCVVPVRGRVVHALRHAREVATRGLGPAGRPRGERSPDSEGGPAWGRPRITPPVRAARDRSL